MKDTIRRQAADVANRVAPRAVAALRDRRHRAADAAARNAPSADLTQQVARLRRRVVALEQEVQENRRLNRRVAELTDVVEELLVPAANRDDKKLRARLNQYGKGM